MYYLLVDTSALKYGHDKVCTYFKIDNKDAYKLTELRGYVIPLGIHKPKNCVDKWSMEAIREKKKVLYTF